MILSEKKLKIYTDSFIELEEKIRALYSDISLRYGDYEEKLTTLKKDVDEKRFRKIRRMMTALELALANVTRDKFDIEQYMSDLMYIKSNFTKVSYRDIMGLFDDIYNTLQRNAEDEELIMLLQQTKSQANHELLTRFLEYRELAKRIHRDTGNILMDIEKENKK